MKRRFLTLPRRSRERIRADLDDELRFYFEMRTRELVASGMSEAGAREEAEREFGDLEQTRRYCLAEDTMGNSEKSRTDFIAELRQDLAQSWRTMRRAPGFTSLALVTLAIGIGATTAIYSAVNGLLLRDLPYRNPDQVVRLWGARVDAPGRRGQISAADFADVRERQRSFTELGAFSWGGGTFIGADESVALPGLRVDPRVFEVLGVRPMLGRAIAVDDFSGADPVVLLGHGMWRRLLGGDSSVVGKTINLSGGMRTVIGVLPPDFFFPTAAEAEVYIPYDLGPVVSDPVRGRRFRHLGAVGRLRPGVSPAQADAEVLSIMRQMEQDMPATNSNMSARVVAIRDAVSGDVRPGLYLLLGASLLVLLIACANVAGMLLARSVARRQELAVRAALGAGRGRLVRQMLTESLVLAVCGGAAGLIVAFWGSRALSAAAGELFPLANLATIDLNVLGLALLVTLGSGVLFGLTPALGASRVIEAALREGGRGGSGTRQRLRTALVTGQLALSVMLLVGAGLLTRSLVRLQQNDLGYDLDSALTFEINLVGPRYRTAATHDQFFDALYDGIRALPGVTAVGGSANLPLRGGSTTSLAIDGKPQAEARLPEVGYQPVSDEYFTAMRVPLRSGRFFTPADHDSAQGVVIVSESMARQYWPGEDPIGSRVRLGPNAESPWATVIGVVGDVKMGVLGDARPTAYVSARQDHWGGAAVVVRTSTDPAALLPPVRQLVRRLDPSLPIASAGSLRDAQAAGMTDRRLTMQLLAAFAVVAVALAAVGVYGVMAFLVASRSREIGVRMALGAHPRSVFAMVLRQGLIPAIFGLVIGSLGAVALGRLMSGMLYGVGVTDGVTYATVAVVLLVVTTGACLVPARRALRVDPLDAMRSE